MRQRTGSGRFALLPKHRPIRAGILEGQQVRPGNTARAGPSHNDVARLSCMILTARSVVMLTTLL